MYINEGNLIPNRNSGLQKPAVGILSQNLYVTMRNYTNVVCIS